MTHGARALQSHDLSEEGIKLWITYILFWPNKDMEGLPDEWSAQCRATSETAQTGKTSSTHSVIPTRRIWNDDYDGQMIFGDLGGLKFPGICLIGEEKPKKKKNSTRKPVPTGDRTRARCVTSAHATTCSTAVDAYLYLRLKLISRSPLWLGINVTFSTEISSYISTLLACDT